MDCSTPVFPVLHLPKLAQTHVHWADDAIQPFHPLSSPSSPAFSLSQRQDLIWVSCSHQVAKYWSFSFSISPSKEYAGLISFRTDWFHLLAVQGTLKNLLQHHSSKASILWLSPFFVVQLSHPYITTRKTTALTRWTFAGKVMSLLFNMLSRFAIAFLPRSKCLLILWLQSPSAVIWEPKKIKSLTISIVSPSICHEVIGPDAMIFVFSMLSFKPAFTYVPYVHTIFCCSVTQLCLSLLWSCGQPPRLFCPWNSPGKNTWVGCHFFLQRIFLTRDQTHIPCIGKVGSLSLSHLRGLQTI